MPTEDMSPVHLHEEEVVAYLGHGLAGERLAQVELHLARCSVCRAEVREATAILRARRRRGWPPMLAPLAAAAAAAILLFTIWPQGGGTPTPISQHRDSPAGGVVVPVAISPSGPANAVRAFVWSRAAGADQYRLTVYDEEGSVLWKQITADSLLAPPDSVPLRPGHQYLWKVEARVGWDAWESSELTPFQVVVDTAFSSDRQGSQ